MRNVITAAAAAWIGVLAGAAGTAVAFRSSPITGTLADWTIALIAALQASLFLWQLWLMRQNVKDAGDAAKAAKAAADAAVVSYRPWIQIEFPDQGTVAYRNCRAAVDFQPAARQMVEAHPPSAGVLIDPREDHAHRSQALQPARQHHRVHRG